MNLDAQKWQRFKLGNLFDIKKGKRLTSDDQTVGSNLYIGAIESNNGVANHIGQAPIHKGNTISLSYNGSVGEAFYQPEPYWATDDVNALYAKFEGFNQYVGLFMAAIIRQEKYRFSYGRKWTLANMRSAEICLPVKTNNDGSPYMDATLKYSESGLVPDWQFMEDYTKSLRHKPITTKNMGAVIPPLNTEQWEEFPLFRLFGLPIRGTRITISDRIDGETPFVTAGEADQGVSEKISNLEAETHQNALTIDMFGNCFYHNDEFKCDDNILVFSNDEINPHTGLFVAAVLMADKYKSSYGRQYRQKDYLKHIIKLPTQRLLDGLPVIDPAHRFSDSGHLPDWAFMESYIKSLPYGDRIPLILTDSR